MKGICQEFAEQVEGESLNIWIVKSRKGTLIIVYGLISSKDLDKREAND